MQRKIFAIITAMLVCLVAAAHAAPTMAGRIKSYNGSTGLLVIELADQTLKTFQLSDKTECEWMGRKTHPSVLRVGSKVSVQIAGALNRSPLKAKKIVDWASSETIVAKSAPAPYHTAVGAFATTGGTGGIPDGAPVGAHSPSHTMAAVAHGGSQNRPIPDQDHRNGLNQAPPQSMYPNTQGVNQSAVYRNQGDSHVAPLEMLNIDPYSNNPGLGQSPDLGYDPSLGGQNPSATMMGVESDGQNFGGDSGGRLTGRIMSAQLEQGFVIIQSFSHDQLQRVLIGQAAGGMGLLTPGQMVEFVGRQTPQGFQASEIKQAEGF